MESNFHILREGVAYFLFILAFPLLAVFVFCVLAGYYKSFQTLLENFAVICGMILVSSFLII